MLQILWKYIMIEANLWQHFRALWLKYLFLIPVKFWSLFNSLKVDKFLPEHHNWAKYLESSLNITQFLQKGDMLIKPTSIFSGYKTNFGTSYGN